MDMQLSSKFNIPVNRIFCSRLYICIFWHSMGIDMGSFLHGYLHNLTPLTRKAKARNQTINNVLLVSQTPLVRFTIR